MTGELLFVGAANTYILHAEIARLRLLAFFTFPIRLSSRSCHVRINTADQS